MGASGGHLNPAITLALFLSGHFDWLTTVLYISLQVCRVCICAICVFILQGAQCVLMMSYLAPRVQLRSSLGHIGGARALLRFCPKGKASERVPCIRKLG